MLGSELRKIASDKLLGHKPQDSLETCPLEVLGVSVCVVRWQESPLLHLALLALAVPNHLLPLALPVGPMSDPWGCRPLPW